MPLPEKLQAGGPMVFRIDMKNVSDQVGNNHRGAILEAVGVGTEKDPLKKAPLQCSKS